MRACVFVCVHVHMLSYMRIFVMELDNTVALCLSVWLVIYIFKFLDCTVFTG